MVAPVTVMPLTVAVAVPVLVSVTCCEALLPVVTEPKFKLDAERLIAAVVPVPLAVMVAGELVALLAIVIVAASGDAVCGVNLMVAVFDVPTAIVSPVAMPLTE